MSRRDLSATHLFCYTRGASDEWANATRLRGSSRVIRSFRSAGRIRNTSELVSSSELCQWFAFDRPGPDMLSSIRPETADTAALRTLLEQVSSSLLDARLRRLAWFFVLVLGCFHGWATRHAMNPDGVSYLDVADKYLQHDWTWAVNAYWSPLYSWLLAAALYMLRPSSYWEYPVVHLVNFTVYVLAFVCFEFLLSQLARYHAHASSSGGEATLPVWAWQSVGYVLFLWSTLILIKIAEVTPDMLVAAAVFLLAGLLIRIQLQPANWSGFVWFGLVLGLAYLAKAVMFPLAFVFLATCLSTADRVRKVWHRVTVSFLVFLLVSAPFLVALHGAKGRWTFGDSGKLAYAWLIDGSEPYIHWRGYPLGTGVPAHPTRKILDSPALYEFKDPIRSTYPPWYDASYWNEGLVGRVNPRGQIAALGQGALTYYAVFVNSPVGMALLVSFVTLQFYRRKGLRSAMAKIRLWNILAPALAALGLYAVIHVETRYIGSYVVLVWLGLFLSVTLDEDERSSRIRYGAVIALVLAGAVVIVAKSITPGYVTLRDFIRGDDGSSATYWQAADGLRRSGVSPGEQVGCICTGFASGSFWGHLAKIRIVAEITSGSDMAPRRDVERFWHSSDEVKGKVFAAFANTGARAVVTNEMPVGVSDRGWERIGNTAYYVYFLKGR